MPVDELVEKVPVVVSSTATDNKSGDRSGPDDQPEKPKPETTTNKAGRPDIPVRKAVGGAMVTWSVTQCGLGVDKAAPAKAGVGFFKWGLGKLGLLFKGKIGSALATAAASQALVVAVSIVVVVCVFAAGAAMMAS